MQILSVKDISPADLQHKLHLGPKVSNPHGHQYALLNQEGKPVEFKNPFWMRLNPPTAVSHQFEQNGSFSMYFASNQDTEELRPVMNCVEEEAEELATAIEPSLRTLTFNHRIQNTADGSVLRVKFSKGIEFFDENSKPVKQDKFYTAPRPLDVHLCLRVDHVFVKKEPPQFGITLMVDYLQFKHHDNAAFNPFL